MAAPVTAALLVIGDEILSGRTKDKNIGYIAEYLTGIGVDLCGGQGRARRGGGDRRGRQCAPEPLHLSVHHRRHRAYSRRHHGGCDRQGVRRHHRRRSARSRDDAAALSAGRIERGSPAHGAHPRGRRPDREPISKAPGFRLGNVFVMAGVPAIMQAMLDVIAPSLETGLRMIVENPSMPKDCPKASMRGPGRDRQRASRRVHRLLSVIFHGGLPQPDRGARQGCRGGCERGRCRPRSAPPPQGRRAPL